MAEAANVRRFRWGRFTNFLLLLPGAGLLVIFYFIPLLQVLWTSVTEPALGFEQYSEIARNPALRTIFGTTFRISFESTLLSLLIGYLLAYGLIHGSRKQVRLMLFCILVPFWISALVRAFAWVMLLRSRGAINMFLMSSGLTDKPLDLLYNHTAVLIGMVHYLVPLAALTMYAQMRGIDDRLVPASRGLGAGPMQSFFRIYLPLSIPGIIAAAILIFISALGFFITPAILGGGKSLMLAEYITFLISDTLNWGLGTALATVLMVATLLLVGALSRVMGLRQAFGGA